MTGCASPTIVEAVNVEPAGGYRLRNDKIEAIISPELRRVISFRRIDGQNTISPDSAPMTQDDLPTAPGYRVISASDGQLIVESRDRDSASVIVRRVYRLEGEKLLINTSIKLSDDASDGSKGQRHGR